jgi:uncharacterized protein (TIGR00106 family)
MLFQLAMFPTTKRSSSGSVSEDVARVIDIIDRSGLPYKTGPMSTAIEGDWEPVMRVINRARLMLRRRGHNRIYIIIHVDDRKGAKGRLVGKVKSIERRLGREVSK